jgi:hypothetical protein
MADYLYSLQDGDEGQISYSLPTQLIRLVEYNRLKRIAGFIGFPSILFRVFYMGQPLKLSQNPKNLEKERITMGGYVDGVDPLQGTISPRVFL